MNCQTCHGTGLVAASYLPDSSPDRHIRARRNADYCPTCGGTGEDPGAPADVYPCSPLCEGYLREQRVAAERDALRALHDTEGTLTWETISENGRQSWLREARAAIAAMSSPWLPIETAPKDGDRILAWFAWGDDFGGGGGFIDMVYWDHDTWVIASEGPDFSRPPQFYAHWMPLPAPPSGT